MVKLTYNIVNKGGFIMKKSKKILSLLLAMVVSVSSFALCNINAFAAGWVDYAQDIEYDVTYTDGWSSSDPITAPGDGYAYAKFACDVFKFYVPQKGTVSFNFSSEECRHIKDYAYIYSINDTSKPIGKVKLGRISDSGRGIYYSNDSVVLNSGVYYLVKEHTYENCHLALGDTTYDLTVSYKPIFSDSVLLNLSSKKKLFKANWKKCANVSGYQLQYSTSKNMKSAKALNLSSGSSSKTVKGLKSKKNYYVRIRTYKVVNINGSNKTYYGKWSPKKVVKTK